MGLQELIELSRTYGRDPDYVVAGGGNASFKDDEFISIKPSGTAMADLTADSMVRLRRASLDAIPKRAYAKDPAVREKQALDDLMAARDSGQEGRPSVETLLHELLPQPYVIHTHPALVNGLTCSRAARTGASRLFPEGMLWVPTVNPGYVLALRVHEDLMRYRRSTGTDPDLILLQNHGIFVACPSCDEIESRYRSVFDTLQGQLRRSADLDTTESSDQASHERLLAAVQEVASGRRWSAPCAFLANREIVRLVASRRSYRVLLTHAYTPDHIVYCGHEPLWMDEPTEIDLWHAELERQSADYVRRNGHVPRIVAVEKVGIFVCGETPARVASADAMFLDLVKVAAYAESFGGLRPMPADKRDFIRSWEVERYRAAIVGSR